MKAFPALAHANLANAITSLSIALGASGSLLAAHGAVRPALVCAALALPCDILDGMVARRFKQQSAFGAQLDTLADAISFCILPAQLGYALGLTGLSAAVLVWFVLGGMWRLARFGQVGTTGVGGSEVFEGFPTAIVAALFLVVAAVVVWLPPRFAAPLLFVFFALSAPLMNANLPIPKRGTHTRLLWVLVPLSVAAACVRLS